ncbi:MAG: WD40/YVTN/BNR-like repeat-containing protein, partial [Limisphaerales bacterium]
MRPVAALLALFLAVWTPAYSQSNWQKVDVPSLGLNASSTLNSITTSNNLVLSSVSGDPTYKAVRSTDGGGTWETPPLLVLPPLKLKSLSSAFLYGVRGDSIMTNNTQGVFAWSVLRPALNMIPADVHYISASPGQAWAVGDTNYAVTTTDNWANFNLLPFSVNSVSMKSVQFFDNNFGFATGRSTTAGDNANIILRTVNGGATWENRGLPDTCTAAPILVVDFINPRIGWAAQTCLTTTTFYKTTDSGATWSNQGIIDPFFQASAIDAVDSLHAWVGGRSGLTGKIAKTSNGGANWGYETIPSSGRLLSIAMK